MNAISRVWASVKAATTSLAMRFAGAGSGSWGTWLLPGSGFDYRRSAGDGRTNAAVLACVRWVQRALTEAPLQIMERDSAGELTPVPDHALSALLETPNDFMSGSHLIGSTVAELMLCGNAYIGKLRSSGSRVVQLWPLAPSAMEPRWPADGSAYISHYEQTVDGHIIRWEIADVIHIRNEIDDPQNARKGLSDLSALYREIATDNESASFSASLVRNQAVPGVVISPEGDAQPSEADLEDVKVKFQQRFGGDQRGAPLVMKGPTKVQILSFSPEQMNLRALRRIPEERISAIFGIPAAVVGLGVGLEQTKVGAVMGEMREQAFESCVVPMQRMIAAKLQSQLVGDFGDPARLRVQFDLSGVRVLQDDQNALHERARADLGTGLVTLNQALQMIGLEPVDGDAGDVRYVPNTVTVKTIDTLISEPPPALPVPTPLRALPAPVIDDADETVDGGKGRRLPAFKAGAALSDDDLLARYEAGLALLGEDLADDLLDAFGEIADVVAGRAMAHLKGIGGAQIKADAISGLVTAADHADVQRLLKSYILKTMRQAAEDLAPLTGGTAVRITRASAAYKQAVADMEARLPGIVETTDRDFGRMIARLERRPGSVPLADVQDALRAYVAESYPGRANAIAVTEGGYAHAAGVIETARRSGIGTRVHVSDGDGDSACIARNGTTATLEEARGIGLLHTNCRLRLLVIVEQAAA